MICVECFLYEMPPARNLTEQEAVKIVTLMEEGYSQREVAQRIGVHHTTVGRCLRRFRETDSYTRRPGQGRKKSTSQIDDRFIRQQALRNRFLTGNELKNRLRDVRNVEVSSRTVRRRLNGFGLTARHPAKGPLLTREHKRARLDFAREHVEWTLNDWQRVLFSDETRVGLRSSDGRIFIWRRPGERYSKACMVPQVAFHGGSIMFWGGISLEARTDITPIRGRALNAQRYIREILEEHVVPFGPFIGDNFLFMDDNARPHRALIVREYLNEVGVERLVWPPRSPDLNLIEHVWDQLKRRIRLRNPAPENLYELEIAVLEEWQNIPQEFIANLFRNIQRRLRAVIQARGGNTRY